MANQSCILLISTGFMHVFAHLTNDERNLAHLAQTHARIQRKKMTGRSMRSSASWHRYHTPTFWWDCFPERLAFSNDV
jgi:hypothetical protein